MENFRFCSIYLLAMTQECEIILTTCHKPPKSQMYYTDVVFINGVDYTHYNAESLQIAMKMKLSFSVLLKFPRLEYKINIQYTAH